MVKIESPFPDYALPRVWGWMEPVREMLADDYSPKTLDLWLDQHIAATAMSWAVYRDGELGGIITFQRISPWLGTAHIVLKEEFRLRRVGRVKNRGNQPAIEQAVREMFGLGIGKLTFTVFRDNLGVRTMLRHLGASEEGVLRHHTIRNGKPVDMVVLGLLKERFNANGNSGRDVSVQSGGGGVLDSGERPVGKFGRPHVHVGTDVLPGDAGPSEAPARL